MEPEEKYIPGYEGRYVVGNLGYVRKVGSDKRNYGTINDRGYKQVSITANNGERRTMLVSRLVADAFIPNPDGRTQVDHINTDRSNNRVDNLRWAWPRENAANYKTVVNRLEPGLFRKPVASFQAVKAVFCDGKEVFSRTIKGMAKILGCSETTVSRVAHNEQPLFAGCIRIEFVPKGIQLQLL